MWRLAAVEPKAIGRKDRATPRFRCRGCGGSPKPYRALKLGNHQVGQPDGLQAIEHEAEESKISPRMPLQPSGTRSREIAAKFEWRFAASRDTPDAK
jgi:hypothetical protein